MSETRQIAVTVNGTRYEETVPVRVTLADFLRHQLGRGEPQLHQRHQALAAGQHAAVLGRDFGQQRHGFIDGFRRVIAKRRRLHELVSTLGLTYVFGLMHGFRHRVKTPTARSLTA